MTSNTAWPCRCAGSSRRLSRILASPTHGPASNLATRAISGSCRPRPVPSGTKQPTWQRRKVRRTGPNDPGARTRRRSERHRKCPQRGLRVRGRRGRVHLREVNPARRPDTWPRMGPVCRQSNNRCARWTEVSRARAPRSSSRFQPCKDDFIVERKRTSISRKGSRTFPATSPSPAEAVDDRRSRTVLIVDDHADVRHILRLLFEVKDFRVVGEAANGDQHSTWLANINLRS